MRVGGMGAIGEGSHFEILEREAWGEGQLT